MTLYANDVERMRIAPDGKVGIGTASPKYPLSVAGRMNGDYYGAWFGGEARTESPTMNLAAWYNHKAN